MRTIDLFAGIGGFRLGFESQGFKTVWANDIDKFCKQTYDANFDEPKLTLGDIGEIDTADIPDFDFLLGGFPCQPFSTAGLKKGLEDDRGNQFLNIVRILKAKKPRGFVLENVKHLVNHDNGRTYKIILGALTEAGYLIKAKVLNTRIHTIIPQNRERIFIVGFKDEQDYKYFRFPKPEPETDNVKDYLETHIPSNHFAYTKLRKHIQNTKYKDFWANLQVESNIIYNFKSFGGSIKLKTPSHRGSPALTAEFVFKYFVQDTYGYRILTLTEYARLQGFPDTFIFPCSKSQTYKQIGNSVTPPLIAKIAHQVKLAVNRELPEGQLNLI